MVRCEFCGCRLKVLVDHWEEHVDPARCINVCRGCHSRLHLLQSGGGLKPLDLWMLRGFKPCGDPNCLLCRLGLEDFSRLVAGVVLRELTCRNM